MSKDWEARCTAPWHSSTKTLVWLYNRPSVSRVFCKKNTTKPWISALSKNRNQSAVSLGAAKTRIENSVRNPKRVDVRKSDVLSNINLQYLLWKNQVISLTPRPCWPHRLDSSFPKNSRLASGSFLISGGTSGAEQGAAWLKPWSPGLVGKVLCWHNVLKIEHLGKYKQEAKSAPGPSRENVAMPYMCASWGFHSPDTHRCGRNELTSFKNHFIETLKPALHPDQWRCSLDKRQ